MDRFLVPPLSRHSPEESPILTYTHQPVSGGSWMGGLSLLLMDEPDTVEARAKDAMVVTGTPPVVLPSTTSLFHAYLMGNVGSTTTRSTTSGSSDSSCLPGIARPEDVERCTSNKDTPRLSGQGIYTSSRNNITSTTTTTTPLVQVPTPSTSHGTLTSRRLQFDSPDNGVQVQLERQTLSHVVGESSKTIQLPTVGNGKTHVKDNNNQRGVNVGHNGMPPTEEKTTPDDFSWLDLPPFNCVDVMATSTATLPSLNTELEWPSLLSNPMPKSITAKELFIPVDDNGNNIGPIFETWIFDQGESPTVIDERECHVQRPYGTSYKDLRTAFVNRNHNGVKPGATTTPSGKHARQSSSQPSPKKVKQLPDPVKQLPDPVKQLPNVAISSSRYPKRDVAKVVDYGSPSPPPSPKVPVKKKSSRKRNGTQHDEANSGSSSSIFIPMVNSEIPPIPISVNNSQVATAASSTQPLEKKSSATISSSGLQVPSLEPSSSSSSSSPPSDGNTDQHIQPGDFVRDEYGGYIGQVISIDRDRIAVWWSDIWPLTYAPNTPHRFKRIEPAAAGLYVKILQDSGRKSLNAALAKVNTKLYRDSQKIIRR